MKYRNVITVDNGYACEVLHPVFGWAPFYATRSDPEPIGARLCDAIEGGYQLTDEPETEEQQ